LADHYATLPKLQITHTHANYTLRETINIIGMNESKNKFSGFKVGDTGVKSREYKPERSFYPKTPKIIQWAIKYSGGLIKNERQASYVILGIAVLIIIFSLSLFFHASGLITVKRNPSVPPEKQLEEYRKIQPF